MNQLILLFENEEQLEIFAKMLRDQNMISEDQLQKIYNDDSQIFNNYYSNLKPIKV